ncbi:hypothetical protein [Paraferrimonas haliotis]|uniref:hypothetical protein n=1 Tax=Paraferrimonas haliotis TaxID=2013866 RepID=UPI000BA8DBEC|nr:hypothetical protein [Paraferrimonas haliotis]
MLPIKSLLKLTAIVILMLSFEAASATLKDPTKPAFGFGQSSQTSSVRSQSLTLNAIVEVGAQRVAIINNKSYKQGQQVGSARINRINKNQVSLDNGRVLTLFTAVVDN